LRNDFQFKAGHVRQIERYRLSGSLHRAIARKDLEAVEGLLRGPVDVTMGKFGCRLYCWGCGGCCIITGVVMGILAAMIPPGMMHSIQESAFDLAYIDDTTQTEAEGLFADVGAPIAESDAFKAWGKTFADGLNDCLKADFAFDWAKTPEDCVDGLHPTFTMYNFTNTDIWSAAVPLDTQEVGSLVVLKDSQKVEVDAKYWDEAGKARFRITDTYSNSPKCDSQCEEFSPLNSILAVNVWYAVFTMIGMGDGWSIAHAVAAAPPPGTASASIDAYLKATDAVPVDIHSALPVETRNFVRMYDFTLFLATPDSPTLGAIEIGNSESYASVKQLLIDTGAEYLKSMAGLYGVPPNVVPLLQRISADAVLGWGAAPYWLDPISSAVFTYNFVAGASEKSSTFGAAPSAFVEEQMSSAFYHEGLGYVSQHYEGFLATTTNNHSCAWDPDCPALCYPTETCVPLAAAGYDGLKIPGTYFGSPKGTPGLPSFPNWILTYYLGLTIMGAGRLAVPVKYKDPSAEEDSWVFEGLFAMAVFKASGWTRRIENCNYPDGRPVGGAKDSPGIDCNWVKDSSTLFPFFGFPLYWHLMINRPVHAGWDPATTNAEDGANSFTMEQRVRLLPCTGNKFCSDGYETSRADTYGGHGVLHYAYEPNLGAVVDFAFTGGLSWKLTVTSMHGDLAGFQMMPLFWFCNYLHLPSAINMDLSKLQGIPAALNGFHIFLLVQCMLSLVGGISCCFCGI
jgi:hypothetical protein